jgi:hypothetical protein
MRTWPIVACVGESLVGGEQHALLLLDFFHNSSSGRPMCPCRKTVLAPWPAAWHRFAMSPGRSSSTFTAIGMDYSTAERDHFKPIDRLSRV